MSPVNGAPLEIERKFLIRRPEEATLRALPDCEWSDIEQTYLCARDGYTDRVRKRSVGRRAAYTRTIKTRVSAMSNEENEREISKEEYEALLKTADAALAPIRKRRYVLFRNGFAFEIDVYPFWQKQAVMEVELADEKQAVRLPSEIEVLREVTGVYEYGNAALSRAIPPEDDAGV